MGNTSLWMWHDTKNRSIFYFIEIKLWATQVWPYCIQKTVTDNGLSFDPWFPIVLRMFSADCLLTFEWYCTFSSWTFSLFTSSEKSSPLMCNCAAKSDNCLMRADSSWYIGGEPWPTLGWRGAWLTNVCNALTAPLWAAAKRLRVWL